ncbi:MAG TPA: hypothetical protein VN513_04565, partial [Gemmatimonadales bacterium]|nr:hypothetical protein [Gemmatimonadales bacterium]
MNRIAGVRQLTGHHAIANHGERVLVGSAVDDATLGLLRRHVMRGPDDHPGPGESAGGLQRLGDAEVGQHHAAIVVEHD